MESLDRKTFDTVIVGAGPSAAGLLRGMLESFVDKRKQGCSDSQRFVRIAVLERGVEQGTFTSVSTDASGDNRPTADRRQGFRHSHPSTHDLRNWFTAAHYSSKSTQQNDTTPLPAQSQSKSNATPFPFPKYQTKLHKIDDNFLTKPTVLYTTTPQQHLGNRIVDVPTGNGWGGSTNINAGLVMEPNYGSCGGTLIDGGIAGDFDHWPGIWKGGKLMKMAAQKILSLLRENDAIRDVSRTSGDPGESESISSAFREEQVGSYATQEISLIDVCSGGNTLGLEENFHHAVTSSSTKASHDISGEGDKTQSKRVNYFSALIDPLFKDHPELESHVTFLSGYRAERILVGCDLCRHAHDSERSVYNGCGSLDDKRQQAHAWAVECVASDGTSNFYPVLIRSKREMIICAGAIGSPALLLASGIGHEDDLRNSGVVPWYEQPSSCCRGTEVNYRFFRKLPVGHNLRDHILLPRTFITPRQRPHQLSSNSIHGWWLLDIPLCLDQKVKGNKASIQLQLADGIQMDCMMPHFAAAAFRRRWSLPFNGWALPSQWVFSLFDLLRRFLKATLTPLRLFTVLHTASINICLLNPKSLGKVSVILQRNKHDPKKYSGAKNDPARKYFTLPTLLSDCNVSVDPGYLSNPQDIDALWMGWIATGRIKRQWFGKCTEILPGFLFVYGSVLLSFIISILNCIFCLFTESSSVINYERNKQNRPSWFSAYASEFTNPYYHWCGTCAIGDEAKEMALNVSHAHRSRISECTDDQNASFVVNERLCVRGILGLHVCDASVFPRCLSATPALTCAALGYAASSAVFLS